MAFKIAVLACVVAAACARKGLPFGGLSIHQLDDYQPETSTRFYTSHPRYDSEDYAPASYQFQYDINDPTTRDIKSQQEQRVNDVLRGQYALVQPDGLRRVVDYSDNGDGFNAVVRYENTGIQVPQPLTSLWNLRHGKNYQHNSDSSFVRIHGKFNGKFL